MFVAIMFIGGMVVVSELGVDLVPLLAGAGVVGVAVGFGAQTMIKDFLNGFILVFEDLMQVGDIVTLSGRTGKVERITLRKVQLRALDGTVNTIPHSEITIIENLTKDHSYYLLEVGVAYKEETDSVIDLLLSLIHICAPRLSDDIWLYGGDIDTLKDTVAFGRFGVMPAFSERLDDLQIKLLVALLVR